MVSILSTTSFRGLSKFKCVNDHVISVGLSHDVLSPISLCCRSQTTLFATLVPDITEQFYMSYNPKTPSRHRARSETKTPLTSSVAPGLNGYSLNTSPTKSRADLTNPFLGSAKLGSASGSKSRQTSPSKRATTGSIEVTDRLRRQASLGLIRKGGVESRIDVVTRDYVPPPKKEVKRSRSQPAVS